MKEEYNIGYNKATERGLIRKLKLIQISGGQCQVCGYDKNISALEFHHIDPKQKEMALDMRHLSNNSEEKLLKEVEKCMLLCSNCHKELHHPGYDKEKIGELLDKIKEEHELIKKTKEFGDTCPVCGKKFNKVTGKKYCSKDCRIKAESKLEDAAVLDLYKKFHSQEKVSHELNVSRKIIRTILKRYGLAK